MNELHFGDNLDVLRNMPAEVVDLIYLDPPFNSNANYNVLYGTKRGGPSQAQSHAFEDTWTWGRDAQRALNETAARHLEAGALLDAFKKVFGDSKMMAYIAMMAVRLVEMRRVLKSSGSLFLHCDPTASHYLKLLLDTIFGVQCFRNEIVWKRTSAHSDAAQGLSRFGRTHDTILYYGKSERGTWKVLFAPLSDDYITSHYSSKEADTGRQFTTSDLTAAKPGGDTSYDWKGVRPPQGRYWAYSRENMERFEADGRLVYSKRGMPRLKNYLDQRPGVALGDVWTDIFPVNSQAKERIGYPTQKPLALLERIIEAATEPGQVVLDPFCGCGTAVEAAERLKRAWIGVDVTYLAIHVIESRLAEAFGNGVKDTYKVLGQPRDANDASVLAARDWLEFQKWAVFALGGLPKEKPGADGGIDGIIRYHRVGIEQPNRAVVSVKGGLNVGVDAVHKLKSVIKRENAEFGVLICLNPPTGPMTREAFSEGDVGPPSKRVPKIQIITVDMLFQRGALEVPGVVDPPDVGRSTMPARQPRRSKKHVEGQGELLFPIKGGGLKETKTSKRSIRTVDIEVVRPTKNSR
ncbi:MAG: restriction endonuclease [Mesorhizobium sp.]|nr:DNA methyltransferase [Mesorhizobium sp.]MBL8577712.1 restriction endonuclease [Mesorhizobium sp.]